MGLIYPRLRAFMYPDIYAPMRGGFVVDSCGFAVDFSRRQGIPWEALKAERERRADRNYQ